LLTGAFLFLLVFLRFSFHFYFRFLGVALFGKNYMQAVNMYQYLPSLPVFSVVFFSLISF